MSRPRLAHCARAVLFSASEFDLTYQISFEPFCDDKRLREMQDSEASRAGSFRPPVQGGRGHRAERSSVSFQNELRARQGQPVGDSDGKVGEAAQISVDWDPIVENTGMSCHKGSDGSPCVFDTFETQARFAARVLARKRMVCAV